MSIIEKINGVFKSIKNGILKTFDFIVKIKDILWLVLVALITLFLISQCDSKNELERDVEILTNNTYALTDSLRHYQDELGNVVAEKHALQLSQEEIEKTIGELKKKNTEYIAYINANVGVRDTVLIEKVVFKDINIYMDEENENRAYADIKYNVIKGSYEIENNIQVRLM